TNCSPTSCDAGSWKRARSTRKSGSTTPCSISPIATTAWTSLSSPSCASWASATAAPSWGAARRWARASRSRPTTTRGETGGTAGPAARAARALRTAAPASALAKRDVVADADVGGERGDHRAILLEREIDGAARLRFVRAFPRDGEHEV